MTENVLGEETMIAGDMYTQIRGEYVIRGFDEGELYSSGRT